MIASNHILFYVVRLVKRYLIRLGMVLGALAAVFFKNPAAAQSISSTVGGLSATPTQRSPASVFWNPAIIGSYSGFQLETNLTLMSGSLIYDKAGIDPNTKRGYDSSSTTTLAPNPFFAVSGPVTNEIRLGYSTYFPSGIAAQFDETGSQRYDLIGGLLLPWHHQVTVAYRPNPQWSFAASGIVSMGFFETELDVDLAKFLSGVLNTKDIPAENPALSSRAEVPLSRAVGYGAAAGMFYWPTYQWSFGLAFFSPVQYTFKSDLNLSTPASISALGSGLKALGVDDQVRNRITADTTLPAFVQAGFRYQPFGYLTGDYFCRYTFNSWSRSMSLKVNSSSIAALNDLELKGKQLDDSYLVGTVQSLSLWKTWNLGFHTSYYRNGVRDNLLSPTRADFDSLLVGPFAGYNFTTHLQLGMEYAHTFMFTRTASDTSSTLADSKYFQTPPSDGSYRASIDRVGVSLKYAF